MRVSKEEAELEGLDVPEFGMLAPGGGRDSLLPNSRADVLQHCGEEAMTLIKSIVRPNKVDEVKDAVGLGVSGMTVTEVRGHGHQKGHTAIYRGREYAVTLLPKMEIEIVVPDAMVDEIVKIIAQAARTGEIGDGRVFVMPVHQS